MNLPNHVAIICDGNRRWAKSKHLPTFVGHSKGLTQAKKLVSHLKNKGVNTVTLYAFSTENWKRSEKEVTYLMKLFQLFIKKNIKEFDLEGGRLNILGDVSKLPNSLNKILTEAIEKTKNNSKFIIQIALNYGGRDEILRAIKKIINQKIDLNLITDRLISQNLDTGDSPDPDLIIRTSGEQRLSNFLIWQSAYSELYFAPEYLPDFTTGKLDKVLEWYEDRKRRFGK